MEKAILGRKLGMTSIFDETGLSIPETVVEAGPMKVVRKKTPERDGYSAVLVSFEEAGKHQNKAEAGVYKKAGVEAGKILREFKFSQPDKYEVGSEIKCDIFSGGDMVDVSAVSKGHGFSGVIKRWNQHRLKETHGVGPVHREPGSMGANSSPSRVFKNKRLAGQYGVENVTVQNLEIVRVDVERNCLLIKGSVPGPNGSVVTINDTVK